MQYNSQTYIPIKVKEYLLSIIIVLFITSCNNNTAKEIPAYLTISGSAQGSTFSVIYQDSTKRDFSKEIDSILRCYDLELSIYTDSSIISEFNQNVHNPYCMLDNSKYFRSCFVKAKEVYYQTSGAFNPAIYPLVR